MYSIVKHNDAYLIEQHMKNFVNFSGDCEESEHFCYELVDVVFCNTGDTSQTRTSTF